MELEQEIEDEQLIRQYLLGELGQEEQAKVQDRLLCDRRFFDRLVIEENELTDDYLTGALTKEREERFKHYFLAAPERRQKLRFAKALKKRISGADGTTPHLERSWRKYSFDRRGFSLLRSAAAAAALLIIAIGGWLAIENARLRKQIDSSRAVWLERARELERQLSDEQGRSQGLEREIERERSRNSALEREVANLKQVREAGKSGIGEAVVSLALVPGLSREGDQPNKLVILRGTNRVRLELYPENAGRRNYRAELLTREGKQVWKSGDLKLRKTASGNQVIVILPAIILTRGDYIVTLRSIAGEKDQARAGTYYFRVEKE